MTIQHDEEETDRLMPSVHNVNQPLPEHESERDSKNFAAAIFHVSLRGFRGGRRDFGMDDKLNEKQSLIAGAADVGSETQENFDIGESSIPRENFERRSSDPIRPANAWVNRVFSIGFGKDQTANHDVREEDLHMYEGRMILPSEPDPLFNEEDKEESEHDTHIPRSQIVDQPRYWSFRRRNIDEEVIQPLTIGEARILHELREQENISQRKTNIQAISGIVCGVAVGVVGGVAAAAQAVANPEYRRKLAEVIKHGGTSHRIRASSEDDLETMPLFPSGKKYEGSKCVPPPLRGNVQGEYSLANAVDCHYEEDIDYESTIQRQQEEIQRLKDRIFVLERDINLRRNFDESFDPAMTDGDASDTDNCSEESGFVNESNTLIDLGEQAAFDVESSQFTHQQKQENEILLELENHTVDPITSGATLNNLDESLSYSNELMSPTESPIRTHVGILNRDEVERYSRHLLLADGFGVHGQKKLLNSSVLVIGAGGIGSTVLLYLAASGIGNIGVVDFDVVEASNLHRQIIHSSEKIGVNKAESAVKAMQQLNPTIKCEAIKEVFDHENAKSLVERYDCVVDASDNPKTRYLVNDACVLAGKPVVSGGAIGTEGQLSVYNFMDGPCYRCLYPNPPPTEVCQSCSDNGVLGPVPGMIGVLQAVEVIKILTGIGETMHNKLLMYDSLSCSFLSLKKPPKRKNCTVCSSCANITSISNTLESFHGTKGPKVAAADDESISVCILPTNLSISCTDYNKIRNSSIKHVLLDVRVKKQFEMCSIDGAVNIPLELLEDKLDAVAALSDGGRNAIYCICRRGIASAEAVNRLVSAVQTGRCIQLGSVKNIYGGLLAWSRKVDPQFPLY